MVQVTLPRSDLDFIIQMLSSEAERLSDIAFYGSPDMYYTERDRIQNLSYKIRDIVGILNNDTNTAVGSYPS